jgi:hypothetical protein
VELGWAGAGDGERSSRVSRHNNKLVMFVSVYFRVLSAKFSKNLFSSNLCFSFHGCLFMYLDFFINEIRGRSLRKKDKDRARATKISLPPLFGRPWHNHEFCFPQLRGAWRPARDLSANFLPPTPLLFCRGDIGPLALSALLCSRHTLHAGRGGRERERERGTPTTYQTRHHHLLLLWDCGPHSIHPSPPPFPPSPTSIPLRKKTLPCSGTPPARSRRFDPPHAHAGSVFG